MLPLTTPLAATQTNGGITNSTVLSEAEHQEYVQRRSVELMDLAMKNDTASRDAILDELQNPDRDIRKAAVAAAIQFGDRSAVPRLQEAADQAQDSVEKERFWRR